MATHTDEKLNQFLLVIDPQTELVKVNFDAVLVKLLRECKYFYQLKLEVPDQAKKIFDRADTYRQQIVSLDMIVDNYNYIKTQLHQVERPLV